MFNYYVEKAGETHWRYETDSKTFYLDAEKDFLRYEIVSTIPNRFCT